MFIIYIPSSARGIRRNINRNNDISRGRIYIIEGKISPNPPSGGYINALLYRKNTCYKYSKQTANSRPFGELERDCLTWLPRMIFHPIFHGQNNIPWSYSLVRSYSSHTSAIRL